MDFSEKLKQIRKSEGKPLLGYYDKFCWVCFTNRGGEKLTSDQLRDSIKAVDILSVSIYTCNSYSQSTTTRKEKS